MLIVAGISTTAWFRTKPLFPSNLWCPPTSGAASNGLLVPFWASPRPTLTITPEIILAHPPLLFLIPYWFISLTRAKSPQLQSMGIHHPRPARPQPMPPHPLPRLLLVLSAGPWSPVLLALWKCKQTADENCDRQYCSEKLNNLCFSNC